MKPNLFLIGYRGTGKTTVGQLLAERVGWTFIDADVYLEGKYGKSIKQIFVEEGEPSFRDKEETVLREVSDATNRIIGTGGGVILRDTNRSILRERGFVVWLTADVPTIADRLAADPTTLERRPDLTQGGRAEIEELLRKREPLYRDCANLEIDTRLRSPEAIVEAILTAWNSTGWTCSG